MAQCATAEMRQTSKGGREASSPLSASGSVGARERRRSAGTSAMQGGEKGEESDSSPPGQVRANRSVVLMLTGEEGCR